MTEKTLSLSWSTLLMPPKLQSFFQSVANMFCASQNLKEYLPIQSLSGRETHGVTFFLRFAYRVNASRLRISRT